MALTCGAVVSALECTATPEPVSLGRMLGRLMVSGSILLVQHYTYSMPGASFRSVQFDSWPIQIVPKTMKMGH